MSLPVQVDQHALTATTPPAAIQVDAETFERVLSELSTSFIALPGDRIDSAIDAGLRAIVAMLGIDRSTVSRIWPDSGRVEVTHSVAVAGVEPVPKSFSHRERAPWGYVQVTTGRPVIYSRLDELPPEACIDRVSLEAIGLKSHASFPLVVAGEVHGGLSFGCIQRERVWPDDLLVRLRLLAEMFASALARKIAHEAMLRSLAFETLATRILASLFLADTAQESDDIESGLRELARFLGVERATLWERVPGQPEFRKTHGWLDAGATQTPDRIGAVDLPWINNRLIEGEVVSIDDLADLPILAAADAVALQALGVRSLLSVPISVAGSVVGALSVATLGEQRKWPESLHSGLQLLAEAFVSLNARRTAERNRRAAEAESALWRERLAHLVRVHTVGEMSVAIAHEITQPLGAIGNYALAARRRLQGEEPDLAKIVELLDKTVAQAARAGDVVVRLRDMVKRHELDMKALDIARTVSSCADMVSSDCTLRDIRIELEIAKDLPVVVADEIHIQQVILNLLRNAIDAIDRSQANVTRLIDIKTQAAAPDMIRVEVADQGPGIVDGDLERVFESFYTTKSDGLGVGLAISRKLIEAHGGALWAAHNPRGGAIFQFTLPTRGG